MHTENREIYGTVIVDGNKWVGLSSKKFKKLSRAGLLDAFIDTARGLEISSWDTITNLGMENWHPEIHAFYRGLVCIKTKADQMKLPITLEFVHSHLKDIGPWIEDIIESSNQDD
jgi:hypothetical protein